MMICGSCREKFKGRDFIHCPYCGESLDSVNNDEDKFLNFFEKFVKDMGSDVAELFEKDALKIFINGKRVEFFNKNDGKHNTVLTKTSGKKKDVKKFIPKSDIVEPLVSIIKDVEGINLEISLPGVVKEEDVLINELTKSVEVLANSKNKTFFTSIKKSTKSEIVEQYFEKGVLMLRLE